jgi:hypothetical protein
MPHESYYKKLFFIGAIWNWVGTVSFAVGYKFLFPLFGMKLPQYPIFFLLFLGLAFVFGIGYYWVSKDIHQNHAVVKMGIIGKLIVFIGLTADAVAGHISTLMIGPGVVDLIFTILFIEFLLTAKLHR